MQSTHIKRFSFFLRPIISKHAVIDFQPTAQARTTSSITIPARKREPVSQSTFFFPSCFVRPVAVCLPWRYKLSFSHQCSNAGCGQNSLHQNILCQDLEIMECKKPKKFNMWKSPARNNSENMRNILRHLVNIFLSKTSWNCQISLHRSIEARTINLNWLMITITNWLNRFYNFFLIQSH